MNLRIGALLAALVAGPPLYGMVKAGLLDSDTAFTRVLLVAVALAIGVGFVARLARGYHAEAEAAAAAQAPAENGTPAADEPKVIVSEPTPVVGDA